MKIERIKVAYFSPTGNVRKVSGFVSDHLADALGLKNALEEINFTLKENRVPLHCKTGEMLIIAIPTYAGRVPNVLLQYLKENLSGEGAVAIPLCIFGNRSVDNALIELTGLLKDAGFFVVGGASVRSQHVFAECIGTGFPNDEDFQQMEVFANALVEKITAMEDTANVNQIELDGIYPPEAYYQPLGVDLKPAKFLKAVPKVDEKKCRHCFMCAAVCPNGSIDRMNPAQMNSFCIKCQACILACPKKARYFDDEAFLSHVEMLKENYKRPAKSCFYL